MSTPTARSWKRSKRFGRYLRQRPRLIWKFDWQAETDVIDVSTDANWCGCKLSRKSTSGGTICRGKHLIKAWSNTQAILAKSSGESELYGVVKGACEGLGVSTLLKDFGEVNPHVRMHLDAPFAKGIIERRGLNKLRHVELDIIWLQEQEARKLLPLDKVLGTDNVADLMTKNLNAATIDKYICMLNLYFAEGRSHIAQKLHSVKVAEATVEPREPSRYIRNIPSTPMLSNPHSALDGDPCKGVDERDSWSSVGVEGIWKREHRRPRVSLFTPMRVAKGPSANSHLSRIRQTRGVRLDTLESFEIADDWTQSGNAHRRMSFPWVGTKTFQESPDFIMETKSASSMRHGDGAQGAREDELFSTPLRPSVPEVEPVAAPVCELREGVGAATPQANSIKCHRRFLIFIELVAHES